MTETASTNVLTRRDLFIGTLIALVMATTFTVLSSGWSLIVTFVPGVAMTAATFGWLYRKRIPMPSASDFLPVFVFLLAIQFLHFGEEFTTGFASAFPTLYGGAPYSANLFVVFNMCAYFVFTVACLVAFANKRWFLLVPALFFIVYGAIGNAIAHTWWSVARGGYFPGLFTAQAYWIFGPLVLGRLLNQLKAAWIVVVVLAVVMIPLLVYFASPAIAQL